MSQHWWGVLYVALGTLMIAGGGLLATLGWYWIRADGQWHNAVVGVVREIELNERMIQDALATVRRWPTRATTDTFSYEDYHSVHVTALVTSGAIEDRNVQDALEAYQRGVSRFNAELRIVGRLTPGVFVKQNLIHTRDVKAWPEDPADALAEPFRSLLTAHETAKSALERRYPWAVSKNRSDGP